MHTRVPANQTDRRRAHALGFILAGSAALFGLAGIAYLSFPHPFARYSAAHLASKRSVTEQQLSSALVLCGLDPKALTAAGLDATSTGTLVGAARGYLSENAEAFDSAASSYRQYAASVRQLEHLARSGRATAQDIAGLASARSSLASAASTRQTQMDALIAAATDGLSQAQRDALAAVARNRRREVPLQYAVVDRSEADWVALRFALVNERIASDSGTEPDSACHTLVQTASANETVSAVAAAITNNSASVASAWMSAVQSQ